MKESSLIFLGFKKKKSGNSYWYELKFKNHKFITSDNNYRKSKFIIGYKDLKLKQLDTYWFKSNISKGNNFENLFRILTDHIFSINGVHKKYKP